MSELLGNVPAVQKCKTLRMFDCTRDGQAVKNTNCWRVGVVPALSAMGVFDCCHQSRQQMDMAHLEMFDELLLKTAQRSNAEALVHFNDGCV